MILDDADEWIFFEHESHESHEKGEVASLFHRALQPLSAPKDEVLRWLGGEKQGEIITHE